MVRGSRVYGSPVTGSPTKQFRVSVACWENGSTTALVGSGNRSMSDSWISWNPRIDEPSKPKPSSKEASVSSDGGTEKCCIRPGRSMNRRSIISMPRSLTSLSTSPTDCVTAAPPWVSLSGQAPTGSYRTLASRRLPTGCRSVSRPLTGGSAGHGGGVRDAFRPRVDAPEGGHRGHLRSGSRRAGPRAGARRHGGGRPRLALEPPPDVRVHPAQQQPAVGARVRGVHARGDHHLEDVVGPGGGPVADLRGAGRPGPRAADQDPAVGAAHECEVAVPAGKGREASQVDDGEPASRPVPQRAARRGGRGGGRDRPQRLDHHVAGGRGRLQPGGVRGGAAVVAERPCRPRRQGGGEAQRGDQAGDHARTGGPPAGDRAGGRARAGGRGPAAGVVGAAGGRARAAVRHRPRRPRRAAPRAASGLAPCASGRRGRCPAPAARTPRGRTRASRRRAGAPRTPRGSRSGRRAGGGRSAGGTG